MGRVKLQRTLNSLGKNPPYPVVIACPDDEADQHKRLGRRVLRIPFKGISATRQYIMEKIPDTRIVMMDDDLTFSKRRTDDPTKFNKPSQSDIHDMLHRLNDALGKYAHVGIAMREGANRDADEFLVCTRMARVIGYHAPTFHYVGVDFRNSTVMDDFEATMCLITHGYPNVVINSYVQNQLGSGTEGGAALYRTLEVHAEAAHTLAARYPQYVRTRVKKTKVAWGGETRTDVLVQWKTAYRHTLRKLGIQESVDPST